MPDQATESSNLTGLTLYEASELVRRNQVSPVDLTKACLDRTLRLNPKLNAFITVTADGALAEAREAEAEIRRGGWRGPLHGIPIALKDLVDTAGVRTTAASGLYEDRVPTVDAEVVRRLRAAGAVFLGKLNMHEFAYGGTTVVSFFGPVRNPWAPEFSAGGSSAGSAAAVAAGLCYGAVGSDTGGSIREPAAFCGIVGLKPTLGRVSTRGAIPLAWSLDHLGPMTRSVRDAALMVQAMAGHDPKDVVSQDLPAVDYMAGFGATKDLRLGLPRRYFYDDLHPEVGEAVTTALSVLAALGTSAREVDVPHGNELSIPVLQAEAYAFHEASVAQSPDRYQPETLKRIRRGAEITTSAYIRARRGLEDLRRSMSDVFASVDVLVTPTTPEPASRIAELLADLDHLRAREIVMLRNTRPWSALGLPSVSVPCGFTRDGLPLGLQITGPAGGEAVVLGLAHDFEQATGWHRRSPAESPLRLPD